MFLVLTVPPNARNSNITTIMQNHLGSSSRHSGITRAEVIAIIAVMSLLGAVLIPRIIDANKQAREKAQLTQCQYNQRKLGQALLVYAQNNGGAFPVSESLVGSQKELVQALTISGKAEQSWFYCPADPQIATKAFHDSPDWQSSNIGYFYFSANSAGTENQVSKFLLVNSLWPRKLNTKMPPNTWVMSDKWVSGIPTTHTEYKKGVNYLMLDGQVEFIGDSVRTVFH